MKHTSTGTTTFTIAKFAQLVAVDRHEIAKRLAAAKAKPVGKSTSQSADIYALKDLVRAATGSASLQAARLKKLESETLKIDLQNEREQGQLVEISKVVRLGQKVMVAVRNRILNMPLTDDEKDSCLRELLALKGMDWTRDA